VYYLTYYIEPESEEDETENESSDFPPEPEILSSHPEQLSSSEQEKLTIYRCRIPDFSEVLAQINRRNKYRSNSLTHNTNLRDIQRKLILVNRPFLPKYVKHKKYRSENASDISDELDEKNYYQGLQKPKDDMYPEYNLDVGNTKPEVKTPNFILNPSPSPQDCDVTRSIKMPPGMWDPLNVI